METFRRGGVRNLCPKSHEGSPELGPESASQKSANIGATGDFDIADSSLATKFCGRHRCSCTSEPCEADSLSFWGDPPSDFGPAFPP